jgi:hypothetical protein
VESTLANGAVRLAVTTVGAGPAVVLAHAGGERRAVWAPLAAAGASLRGFAALVAAGSRS